MIYYIGNHLNVIDDINTSTLKDAYEYCKDKFILGLDIETTKKYDLYPEEGLDPYTSDIVMVQIGDEENQYIIDYRHLKTLGPLKQLLEDKEHLIVGHNLKFEYKHIAVNENIKINNLYDTMIAEQIMFSGIFQKNGLKDLAHRYLNKPIDKTIRLGFLTIGSRPFTKNEIQYGADDVILPLKIKKLQKERINKYDLQKCISLEMLFIPVLGDIELKGMCLNKDKWLSLYNKNKVNSDLLVEKLDDLVIRKVGHPFIKKQLDLFNSKPKCNINWASSKQVISLFKFLKICPKEISKSTGLLSYTVNATVLETHKKTLIVDGAYLEILDTYLNYKKIEQRCTTFGKDFLNYINPITKRIHCNYRQILNTGRISSNSPNLQNIPSDEEFRECFDAPPNSRIVNADYSGQEQIILANYSKAINLLEFYKNSKNADMHSYVASKIFKIPLIDILSAKKFKDTGALLTKYQLDLLEKRNLAKGAGFAINYGGTGYTISKNLGINEKLGNEVYKEYFKSFPGLKRYFEVVQQKTIRQGYVLIDNLTKRKYFFRKPTNNKELGAIKRTALNFPIQGTAGSITKLAAILFIKKLKEQDLYNKVFITNLVHDEINVETNKLYAYVAASLLEDAMAEAGSYWCKTVPLEAKAVISLYWGH